jgi:hypothetical protein
VYGRPSPNMFSWSLFLWVVQVIYTNDRANS